MDDTPRRVLITGAAGFLGAHLAAGFYRAGWQVLAVVRQPGAVWRLDRLAPEVPRLMCDMLWPVEDWRQCLINHSASLLINCAAYGVNYRQQDEAMAMAVNAEAPGRLVEAAARAGVKSIIHIGTSQEYGSTAQKISETTPLSPSGIYGRSKAKGTLAVLAAATAHGLPAAALRPFVLYGPHEEPYKFASIIARNVAANQHIALTAGDQLRDHLYVGDMVSACLKLAGTGNLAATGLFNIGSGEGITLRAFGEAVAREAGGGGQLDWGALPYRADEVMSAVADITRIRAAIGWRPETELAEGLRRSLAALVQYP